MKKAIQIKEIKEKDNKALFKELEDLSKKIVELRFDNTFRKLKNVNLIRENRRKQARIWTVIHERAIAKAEK